ncbi:N-acyl homoserine lactonase family protein [Ovoidimarina sediminis]|uniref:N-acyl homoserine lactonase family protein n=1 Tax=Ovoidimarina sediminis TaxID=3079856 RepID=UPI002907825A|nr:N-acyl homoserine lactonase family protein [Rhodophyticola sp. MJ-SS7]MDU8943112.1 N-acyl homoserine lactonase family protein [Rhodophyticola sp. MJ-SS7]
MDQHWEVYAVKYADRNARVRGDSFIFDDHPAAPHGMDFFVWVLRSGDRTILVDTGYDEGEGARRDRPILRDPAVALGALGLAAETVETVIITHLHYDHAGGLDRYPMATFHLQEAEMAYATGPCMCHPAMQMPFTADHVCEMVRHVYSGRVAFHKGSAEVAPGVRVHRTGGHSRGLQVVEVATATGPLCLASDAAHFYENFQAGKPFPIVIDLEDMLEGFKVIRRLGGGDDARVIPGHDPLVRERFPEAGTSGFVWRLDKGPVAGG